MSPSLQATAISPEPSQSKRYPYARPRRATTRPTPKAALYGALQPKKRGHNFSLGSKQTPRNVSTYKSTPVQESMDVSPDTGKPATAAINIDPALEPSIEHETAYVPLKLPRVQIPPVDHQSFCFGRLFNVPPEYVLSQVKAMSPSMLKAATMYRPTPPTTDTSQSTGPLSDRQVMDIVPSDTIRFDIPDDLYSTQQLTLSQLGGMEPTHCLAVRPRSRTSRTGRLAEEGKFGPTLRSEREEVGRMIPIHHIVYASQCANFPRPVQYVPSTSPSAITSPMTTSSAGLLPPMSPVMLSPTFRPAFSPPSEPAASLGEVSVQLGLANGALRPHEQKDAHTLASGPPSVGSRTAYARSSLSSVLEEPDVAASENQSNPQPQSIPISTEPRMASPTLSPDIMHPPLAAVIDMPMIHVTVPHPSEMNLVQGWLYNASPPLLLSSLLALPKLAEDAQGPSPATLTIPQRLSALPARSILECMQRAHRVWGNVVAFGIADPLLWKVMDRAWDLLVAALKDRGGDSVREVAVFEPKETEEGLSVHSEVVRKFSMATIRDPRSRAGSMHSD